MFISLYILSILVYRDFMIAIWVIFALMLIVGLFGGASYVNAAYLILKNDKLMNNEKELSMNISIVHNDFGRILSSIFCLIVNNFEFPK